jgi:aryl-alcohol dehydrogenase-like predicted oxidoreductase
VVIATKFGFNIDADGTQHQDPPLNSRPEHIREVAEASLNGLGRIASICSTSIALDPDVPIEDCGRSC